MSVLGLLLTLIVGVFIYGGSLCSIKYTNNKFCFFLFNENTII